MSSLLGNKGELQNQTLEHGRAELLWKSSSHYVNSHRIPNSVRSLCNKCVSVNFLFNKLTLESNWMDSDL